MASKCCTINLTQKPKIYGIVVGTQKCQSFVERLFLHYIFFKS